MNEDIEITLRQGLAQFYKVHEYHLNHNESELPDEVKAFFKSHDIAHVLFGCDISLFGEGAVKIWTIFGTTLGFWNHIGEYKKANAFELTRKLNPAFFAGNLFKLLLSIPVLIFKARKMHQPWPWSGFEPYLDVPIAEIRKEFNIRIL